MHNLKIHLLLLFLLAGTFILQAQPEDLAIARAKRLQTNVVKLEVKYQDEALVMVLALLRMKQMDNYSW